MKWIINLEVTNGIFLWGNYNIDSLCTKLLGFKSNDPAVENLQLGDDEVTIDLAPVDTKEMIAISKRIENFKLSSDIYESIEVNISSTKESKDTELDMED